ncbi:MAG: hypothetical protein IT233_00540 [Bacteroidia bacterium]|nr:hypothetical protein [Bacteroidia bacterium]
MVQIYHSVRKFVLWNFILLSAGSLSAQTFSLQREKFISVTDSIELDSLTILPNSLRLYRLNGELLDSNCYRLLPDNRSLLLLKTEGCLLDSVFTLLAAYSCLPYRLDRPWLHKDPLLVKKGQQVISNPFLYKPATGFSNDLFQIGSLNKEGSITRGLNFGSNQDVVVNSSMNLQLSGKLSEDLDLLLSATDDNIPVQADGTTAQLQEFDKIFIQISDKRQKLIAGDFEMKRPLSYFMNYHKKAQGLFYETRWNVMDRRKNGTEKNKVFGGGAVSKGKFARNVFQGTEGNQGPYRLRGSENELFIIILSGTETVYIDGELLKRGMENDYVIDYNTAEITFTPHHVITKDKRITVEFQYSDKLYARSVFTGGYEYEYKSGNYKERHYLFAYSEQDAKNKPLQQSLTEEDKQLMSIVGDSIQDAYILAADSVAFSNSEVLYDRTDSLVGTYTFPGVYIYSTDPDSARFRLSFSYVGPGRGNYEPLNTSANGKVYRWLIPDTVTGSLRGSYEPVLLLVSPKKKQMVTAGTEIIFGPHKRFMAEGSFTVNDINLFSTADKRNDQGYGGKMEMEFPFYSVKTRARPGKGFSAGLKLGLNYEFVNRNFAPVERFRGVEFDRDWNRTGLVQLEDLHWAGARIAAFYNERIPFSYSFSALLEGNRYSGMLHELRTDIRNSKTRFQLRSSQLSTTAASGNTGFRRVTADVSRQLGPLVLGSKAAFEENIHKNSGDTLLPLSFRFLEWEVYSGSRDSAKVNWRLSYRHRTDDAAGTEKLMRTTEADNYSGTMRWKKGTIHALAFTGTFRRLRIIDSTLTAIKPDESVTGRVEYDLVLWKGVLISGTFFEAGAGLEQKKEFAFLEVPAGQGIYTWIDHNGNGIRELNEFEIAAFPDQATFIKVFIPTQDYIRTYYNQFAQSFTLRPAVRWRKEKGWKKGISRFSNQISFHGDRKSTETDLLIAYNPFLQDVEENTLQTLNSRFRNTLWVNQGSPDWAADVSWNDQRNKSLLSSGFDTRGNAWYESNVRWSLRKRWSVQVQYKDGYKSFRSDFFPGRNYHYHYYETQPRITYQHDASLRLQLSYRYSEKMNAADLGGHRAKIQNAGIEFRYNTLQKGSFTAKANFIYIRYRGTPSGSVSFEFLEGLNSGNNITWGLNFQRTLSNNLQINLSYDGRLPEGLSVIHTGGAQVRAYF